MSLYKGHADIQSSPSHSPSVLHSLQTRSKGCLLLFFLTIMSHKGAYMFLRVHIRVSCRTHNVIDVNHFATGNIPVCD